MEAEAIIQAVAQMIELGAKAVQAANAGDLDTANATLAQMRDLWQQGSDALDAALAQRKANQQ